MVVDWALTNQEAVEFAQHYSFERVPDLLRTDLSQMQRAFAEWIASGETPTQLVTRLAPLFHSVARAAVVATTETTRIYAIANAAKWEVGGVAPAAGLPPLHDECRCYIAPHRLPNGLMVIKWQTAQDDYVCRHEKRFSWGVVNGCAGLAGVIVSRGDWLGQKAG